VRSVPLKLSPASHLIFAPVGAEVAITWLPTSIGLSLVTSASSAAVSAPITRMLPFSSIDLILAQGHREQSVPSLPVSVA